MDRPPEAPAPAGSDEEPPRWRYAALLEGALGMSRYAIGIAVAGTFVAGTALLVYGAVEVVQLVRMVLEGADVPDSDGSGSVRPRPMLLAIAAVDAFLVAVVLYVIAIGLYQLFIRPLALPPWLVVENLHDLEYQLVGVVISVLGVVFLGFVVTWDGEQELMGYGLGIAGVIAALTFYLGRMPGKRGQVKPIADAAAPPAAPAARHSRGRHSPAGDA